MAQHMQEKAPAASVMSRSIPIRQTRRWPRQTSVSQTIPKTRTLSPERLRVDLIHIDWFQLTMDRTLKSSPRANQSRSTYFGSLAPVFMAGALSSETAANITKRRSVVFPQPMLWTLLQDIPSRWKARSRTRLETGFQFEKLHDVSLATPPRGRRRVKLTSKRLFRESIVKLATDRAVSTSVPSKIILKMVRRAPFSTRRISRLPALSIFAVPAIGQRWMWS